MFTQPVSGAAFLKPVLSLIVLVCSALTICAASNSGSHLTGIASVNGTQLAYEATGKGKVLVLVHGGLVDSRVWDDEIGPLSKHYRVIRYDLRGFGKSAFPTGRFSHVDDLYALLKYLKVERASLMGLSLGGMIVTEFTLEHPEMVERLVLVSAGLRGYQGVRNEQAIAAYKAAETEGRDKAIELWLDHPFFASGKNNARYRRRVTEMLRDNFKYWGPTPQSIQLTWPTRPAIERLSEIHVPTLIVVGDRDISNILSIAALLKDKIVGSREVTIPNVSHHLTMEKPKQFNQLVQAFLSQ